MQLLRSWIFVGLFYGWTVFCLLTIWPMLLWSQDWGRSFVNGWSKGILALLRWIVGIKYEVRGIENLPGTACLIAAKHHSAWEIFTLLLFVPNGSFVMKRELIAIPLFGWYALRLGMIPVERDKGAAALRRITELAEREVTAGHPIIIFPEGTRRPVGAEPDYKSGIAHFYKRFNLPCVPVGLNSGLHWVNGATLKRPGTIVVSFLPVIEAGMRPKAFLSRMQEAIEAETAKLVAEDV